MINEMVYIPEHGYVDTPSHPNQFKIIKGVVQAIKIAKKLGYKVIIISNQPGIAKGYYTKKTFDEITIKMHTILQRSSTILDDEYYCLHHPRAKMTKYKKRCSCRKPNAGLLKRAAIDYDLDLEKSYFIGDGIVDMEAAKNAECKSIFVGNINTTISRMFNDRGICPKYIAKDLLDAVNFIKKTQ